METVRVMMLMRMTLVLAQMPMMPISPSLTSRRTSPLPFEYLSDPFTGLSAESITPLPAAYLVSTRIPHSDVIAPTGDYRHSTKDETDINQLPKFLSDLQPVVALHVSGNKREQ